MAFESIAQMVLNKFLQKIFFGISSKNIQFQLLQGKFVLSNIGLQPSLITNLNLPIELKHSYVERVEIHIPWREDQVSLTINISNIYVLVIDSSDNFHAANIFMKGKEAVISAALKQFKSNLQRQNKKDIGFIQRLFLNLLDNVNIKIQCIHFRYENKIKNYSFGIKINEVSAKTVDNNGKPIFFNRQKSEQEYVRYVLQMDFMGFYFNSKQDYFLCNKTLAEITDEFNRLSNLRKGGNLQYFDSQDNMDSFNYILTISLKTLVKKNVKVLENLSQNKDEKYLFTCEINLNKIHSRITHQQYYDIFDLINGFSEYQRKYQQHANTMHLLNYKEKKWKDVKDLLQKKKDRKNKILKKENQALKNTCTKYLLWLFRHAHQQVLKRRFIKQAIKRQITVQNVKKNRRLLRIMQKIENDKLKYWLLISLYYRKKFEGKVSLIFRNNNTHIERFSQKYIDSLDYFSLYQFEDQINKMRETTSTNKLQVFLKLKANIEQINFEISKDSTFGVSFDIKKLKAQLIVREKNYQVSLSMQDMQANVFNCKKAQKLKTYVPIIKRNCVFDGITDLLQIKYERNPIGKPFVFHEIDILFESIQITIYPEAFKKFYQILLGDRDTGKLKNSAIKKKNKRASFVQAFNQNQVKQFRLQKTVIKGKVKSPWIVLPLSINNDMSKQCWVVRLGDFYINTYQNQQSLSDEQLYYQKYQLQLKRFQLNYFSSINFFHNWQKFNQNMQTLSKIKSFSKEKIITMISPMSCNVDLSMLRSNLPISIKDKNYKFKFQILIDQINIKISKFLLTKMKYRFDIFGQNKQELNDFIQTNVENMREQNDLCGYCKISYDKLQKINFYCVLKDNYMYFFINQHAHKYHFFVNLTEVAIRLVSNQIQNFNTYKEKMICFYLGDRQRHQNWRKKIIHLINRKDRRMDATIIPSARLKDSQKSIQYQRQSLLLVKNTKELIKNRSQNSKEQKEQEENNQQSSSSTKLKMEFKMNKLTIRLLDQHEEQFLDCLINKAKLTYQVLINKEMKFELDQWIVNQTSKKQVFVSSSYFYQKEEQIELNRKNINNFLKIKFNYNIFTSQLQSIEVEVNKVFIAWKVQLFTKVLLYFYYEEQAGDAPSPVNLNKKQLVVQISLNQFTFYAYFNEQLIALGKMRDISLIYTQNNILQSYEFGCKMFEMDKYVGGDREQRLPMIKIKNESNLSGLLENSLHLEFILRKKETQAFEEIQRLKDKLGKDILVSQLTCIWKDSIIYFQNQFTFRLLNYILNKILGTVVTKFKKREYSPNYIFEAMKIRKVTTFDVKLINFQFRMPPHIRDTRQFCCFMDLLHVKRNLDKIFLPTEVQVETKRDKLKFLWQSMIFAITNVRACYKVGQQLPNQMHQNPFNINFIYSKLNFQRQYFVILKHHDDINRKAVLDLMIQQPVVLEAHKIMFVTFLQLFYQNLKHKDGLAQKFEPSLPFPSLRQYNIHIQKAGLNMYHYLQKSNKMQPFSMNLVNHLNIKYVQVGSQSKISLEGLSARSKGELVLYPLDETKKKFNLEIQSQQGQMKVVVNAQHYALQVNLDNVNNIVEFINYDNDYVSNKIMPKKPSSWQYVNFFAKSCQVRLGQLHASGEFYITYLKGMKNDLDLQAKKYLLTELEMLQVQKDSSKLNWNNLVDKQIKVNGQDLKLSINEDPIGRVNNLIFNRVDITSKTTNRRYKRQRVQVGDGDLYVQLVDLMTIWKVYNSHIKKNPNFVLKSFYEPWDKLPPKQKTIQKRQTQVQIQQLAINLIPNLSPQMMLYLTIYLEFPLIVYKTYLDQQQVIVNIKVGISHNKSMLKQVKVGACRLFQLRYLNYKDRKQKCIQIVNAKNVAFQLNDISNRMISCLIQQAKLLKTALRKPINFNKQTGAPIEYLVMLVNETNHTVKININGLLTLACQGFAIDAKKIARTSVLQMFTNSSSYLEVSQNNELPVKKLSHQISFFSPTSFKQSLLILKPQQNRLNIVYRSPFRILNKSTSSIICKIQKKIIKPHQEITFNLRSSTLQLELKSINWSQVCTIDVHKQNQIIGDYCFVASVSRQNSQTIITIKDRYVLKYVPPVQLQLTQLQFSQNHEVMLGFVPPNLREKYPFKIDGVTLYLNLLKQQKRIEYQKKMLANNRQLTYNLAKCEILINYNNTPSGQTILMIYCSYGIKNDTEKDVIFGWNTSQFILGSKQSVICPASFDKLYFKDNGFTVPVVLKPKQKSFYSQFLKFSLIVKYQNRINVIKIESKYMFVNNSNQVIEILRKDRNNEIVKSYCCVPLNDQNVKNHCLSLLFGKYHRKNIDLQKFGVNYLEMEDLYFKIAVVEKEEQVTVVLENSSVAHLIVNNLEHITITATSPLTEYQRSQNSKANKMVQLESEQSLTKLVKPGEQQQIGILNWSEQVIQLQFYYDAKNIEFKNKFILDFSNVSHEYTLKHVLKDEKDHKILFIVVLTLEKDTQGRFTITAFKEKNYENSLMQKLRFSVYEVSVTLGFTSNTNDSITLECYKANVVRQKSIDLQDFDIQVQKLLIRQGKNISILSALSESKFLNCHIIINKALSGICLNNFFLKITPIEIICREKIIFMILQKAVGIRFENSKKNSKSNNLLRTDSYRESNRFEERHSSLLKQASNNKSRINRQSSSDDQNKLLVLDKDWQSEITKLIKSTKMIIKKLQVLQTSMFLSYSKQEYRPFDEKITNDQIIKYMLIIPSISELKIALPHLQFDSFEGDKKQFLQQLKQKLRQSIGSTVLNALSSLPLFDSPVIAADGIYKYIDGMLSIQ